MDSLAKVYEYVPPLLVPTHRYLPFGLLDLYGAARLSLVIDWIATGAFDPPPAAEVAEKGKKKSKKAIKARATLLQELFGLMLVLFGGETFLALCTNQTPSWLISPNVALLFGGVHALQTRTSLRRLLPYRPRLGMELLLTVPDAIGRALLLTKFTVCPLLYSTSSVLPKTPTTLLLTPILITIPFASLAFSTFNLFSPTPKLDTPLELRPYGWAYADTFLPVVVPVLFLSLLGPVEGWPFGLSFSEPEAIGACILFVWFIFAGKTIYNMGYKREQWAALLGGPGRKIKTA